MDLSAKQSVAAFLVHILGASLLSLAYRPTRRWKCENDHQVRAVFIMETSSREEQARSMREKFAHCLPAINIQVFVCVCLVFFCPALMAWSLRVKVSNPRDGTPCISSELLVLEGTSAWTYSRDYEMARM